MASFSPISLARQMCGPSSETALTISAGCPTRSHSCLRGMKSGGPRCWACSAARSRTVYFHRVTYLTANGGTGTDFTYQRVRSRPRRAAGSRPRGARPWFLAAGRAVSHGVSDPDLPAAIDPRSLKAHTVGIFAQTPDRARLEAIDLVRFVTIAPPKSDASLFHLVLIKPTHDDDGYPIQWVKAAIPSNTLACLNGLAEDASRRRVLGTGVAIPVNVL